MGSLNSMGKVRIGIDGCGILTRETILPHLSQPDFTCQAEVVAVADIVPERARLASEEHGIPSHFSSLEEMLEKTELDAVLIIVPHALHADHALRCLQKGCHVYVQKPFAPSVEEGRAVMLEARSRGLKVVAAPGQILWPLYQEIKKIIADGEIGVPYFAVPPMLGWGGEEVGFPSDPSWFFAQDAGPLRDHGGYGIATLVTLFGPVQKVAAMMTTPVPFRTWQGTRFDVGCADNTAVLLEFAGGTLGLMADAWSDSAPAARFLRIHGLKGAIECSTESANGLTIFPYGATVHRMGREPLILGVDQSKVPCLVDDHFRFGHVHVYSDILHLVECIREDKEPLASGELGLHAAQVMETAFRAASTGMTQSVL